MADSFLQQESPFNEDYFEQYSQQVGDNRIAPIKEELKEMSDPEEMMLLIMDTLKDVEVVPDVGQYYTFIYKPKTPNITYDEHPLVAVTEVLEWGFRGINLHFGQVRQYTFPEIIGQVHLVRGSEFEDIKHIPYARIKTSR